MFVHAYIYVWVYVCEGEIKGDTDETGPFCW